MKTLLLAIALMLVVILTGCQEPTLRSQTIALNTTVAGFQWAEAFGDNVDTAQSFNLMILNEQYAKLDKKITAVEGKLVSSSKDCDGFGDRLTVLESWNLVILKMLEDPNE